MTDGFCAQAGLFDCGAIFAYILLDTASTLLCAAANAGGLR